MDNWSAVFSSACCPKCKPAVSAVSSSACCLRCTHHHPCCWCRELTHPRIVGLRDIFEIDTHTFATVLEVCRGGDLESYLREHQVLLFRLAAWFQYVGPAWLPCSLLQE